MFVKVMSNATIKASAKMELATVNQVGTNKWTAKVMSQEDTLKTLGAQDTKRTAK